MDTRRDKENLWFLNDDNAPEDDEEEDYSITVANLFEDEEDEDDEGEDLEEVVGGIVMKPSSQSTKNKNNNPPQEKKQEKAKETPYVDDNTWITSPFCPPFHGESDFVGDMDIDPSLKSKEPTKVSKDDVKALEEWLVKEGINEPLSDIPEYNLLLDLAADYEKNYDILIKVLTPKTAVANEDVPTSSDDELKEVCMDDEKIKEIEEAQELKEVVDLFDAFKDLFVAEEPEESEKSEKSKITNQTLMAEAFGEMGIDNEKPSTSPDSMTPASST